MTNAYSVFARTKPKNIVDRANYDTVVNLLKRSTLSSVLKIKYNVSVDKIFEVIEAIKAIDNTVGDNDTVIAAVKVETDKL